MDSEKRRDDTPIPENLKEILNEAQRQALAGLEFFGWEPRFMRKKMFQPPVLVMHNPNDGSIGIIDEDGRIQADVKVREQDCQTPPPRNNHYY